MGRTHYQRQQERVVVCTESVAQRACTPQDSTLFAVSRKPIVLNVRLWASGALEARRRRQLQLPQDHVLPCGAHAADKVGQARLVASKARPAFLYHNGTRSVGLTMQTRPKS